MSASLIAVLFSTLAGLALFSAAIFFESRAAAAETVTVLAEKLPTDSWTRASMEAIRSRVIASHTLITHRRMTLAAATQFAIALKAATDEIARVRSERLPPPDALMPLLEKIQAGGDVVAGKVDGRDPIDGLFQIVSALETYAQTFDHPGWRGLQNQ